MHSSIDTQDLSVRKTVGKHENRRTRTPFQVNKEQYVV